MIGTVAGNFKILEEIGEGGMGKVYRGVDTMLDREVAIKVLRPELTSQPHLVDRFRTEAMTLAELSHPNIAMLYAFFQHEQHFFMVMEFVRGETLDKRIRRTGLLAYDQALKVFLFTLEALGYAHSMNVVHRDIKPNNVMMTEQEVVKVMDFGIARVVGSERMTREGSMIGTPEYMAPEQIRGLDVDPRTDIYALGILLYEMLTGRLPFMSQNQFELMRMHIEQQPPSPRAYAPHVPPSMEQIMLRALAKRKEDRFESAYEFRDAILDCPDLPPSTLGGLGGRTGMVGGPSFSSPSIAPRYSQPSVPPLPPTGRQTVVARPQEPPQRAQAATAPSVRQPMTAQPQPAAQANATQYVPAPAVPAQEEKARGGVSKPMLLGGAALAAAVIAVVAWLVITSGNTPKVDPGKKNTSGTTTNEPVFKPDMVQLAGGSFRLGRADLPGPKSEEDMTWALLQWPANVKTVTPFAIDRTEVSSAEYAQFVKETGHTPPPEIWKGNEPFAGQENWPVRNITHEDAVAFAGWRSKRDGVTYRLPTEEEWEFAARNGDRNHLDRFPWGSDWDSERANVNAPDTSNALNPVNVDSYPKGATKQGVLNMIGNVAEMTSTPFAYYVGNDKFQEPPPGNITVRGGSYISELDGPKPLRITQRGPADRTKQDKTIGFRLVRSN